MALDTLSKAIGDTIDLSVGDIIAKYGGDKRAIALAAQKGEIDPTKAVMAGMAVDRVVASAAQPQNTTVAEDVLAQQPAGIGAMAPQGAAPQMGQPQVPQRPGQGLNQVPVPQRAFAQGGIIGFQPGGAVPSFANMYAGLDTDIDALRGVLGAYPTESPEERAKRRREENAIRLMEVGLGIAGGESPYFAANLKGALPGLRGAAEDIRAQRKEDVAMQMAQRAETGKLLEGVLGTRGKAAEAAAADARAKADREAKITAANIAAGKPTDMRYYADMKLRASKGDQEAKIIVEGIDNYLQQSAFGRTAVAAQGVGVQQKRLDVDLYDKAVEYTDSQIGRGGPRYAEYRKLQKKDQENAAKGEPTNLAEEFEASIRNKYMSGVPGQRSAQPGAAPQGAGTKESPLPMPKTAAEAIAGKVYMTARGPARWNGKEFVPVQ